MQLIGEAPAYPFHHLLNLVPSGLHLLEQRAKGEVSLFGGSLSMCGDAQASTSMFSHPLRSLFSPKCSYTLKLQISET